MADVVIGIAVMMVLMAAGSYGFSMYIDNKNTGKATAETGMIANAISRYRYEMRSYPGTLTALTSASGVYGPWLTAVPTTDPWGDVYHYYSGPKSFAVWSNGVDKVNNSGSGVPSSLLGDDVGFVSQ